LKTKVEGSDPNYSKYRSNFEEESKKKVKIIKKDVSANEELPTLNLEDEIVEIDF
jgi:hypothetical protein